MASSKRYEIKICPVSEDVRGIVSFLLTDLMDSPKHLLTTDRLTAVLAEGDRLAAEFKAPCMVAIRCLDKRKPPGFDKATSRIYRNLAATAEKAA